MENSLGNSIAMIKHLKAEYEEVCVEVTKAQSQLDTLKEIVAEKQQNISGIEKENLLLDEKFMSLSHQIQVADSVISHYRDIKRWGNEFSMEILNWNVISSFF